jgi:hypothetical protein
MTKIYFETAARITTKADELGKDCKRLKELVAKSTLLDEIIERTLHAKVEIRFSGSDTNNITCSLNAMFTQKEALEALIALNTNVDNEIRSICKKYPKELFNLQE